IEIAAELRCDDEAVALLLATSEVIADDLLRMALGVEIGSVDEVAAELYVAVDDPLCLLNTRAPAKPLSEPERSEAQWAAAQAGTSQGHIVVQWHDDILRLLVSPGG